MEVEIQRERISIDELVRLAAIDNNLFARSFFPRAARMESPPAHEKMWNALDNPLARFLNLRCFRGAAKTTICRMWTAKRIAYSLSKTVLYVGASEGHATRTIQWLRSAIDRNKFFAGTFGLIAGKKWTDTEIEILNTITGETTWIIGVGITGNIRGINFEDFRPDLIVLDDVVTDENALTEEARDKMINLVLGAVKGSLASATEFPNAKMALLQTPIHPKDVSGLALDDEQFVTVVVPCWTDPTYDLPIHLQMSAWEDMFPTETLRADKRAAIKRNKLSVFSREMECKIRRVENTSFLLPWLKLYQPGTAPKFGRKVLAIDPVPPPSPRQIAMNLVGKDYEAHTVWGRHKGGLYLHDYVKNRGHEPEWSVANALQMAQMHKVSAIIVEMVAYQRVLKNLIEAEMRKRRVWFPILEAEAVQSKFVRITNAFSQPASQGEVYVSEDHTDFIEDFAAYPGVDHDDLLDSSAIAVNELRNPLFELSEDDYTSEDDDYGRPISRQGAP